MMNKGTYKFIGFVGAFSGATICANAGGIDILGCLMFSISMTLYGRNF